MHLVSSFDRLPEVHGHLGLICRVSGSPILFIDNYYAYTIDCSDLSLISRSYFWFMQEPSHSVCTLSSDSESPHDGSSIKVEEVLDKELLIHDAKATKKGENDVLSKQKSPKKKPKKEEQEKKIRLENQLNEGKPFVSSFSILNI